MVGKISAHARRVSFCKTAIDSGATIESVSEAMNHRSIETTRTYYKSDHISLALAQKTKATFHGGLKETDQADEEEEGLDFEKFDFDAFEDYDCVDPDAGKSTASHTNPTPAASVPVLAVIPRFLFRQ